MCRDARVRGGREGRKESWGGKRQGRPPMDPSTSLRAGSDSRGFGGCAAGTARAKSRKGEGTAGVAGRILRLRSGQARLPQSPLAGRTRVTARGRAANPRHWPGECAGWEQKERRGVGARAPTQRVTAPQRYCAALSHGRDAHATGMVLGEGGARGDGQGSADRPAAFVQGSSAASDRSNRSYRRVHPRTGLAASADAAGRGRAC
jgi:hypothetical protein